LRPQSRLLFHRDGPGTARGGLPPEVLRRPVLGDPPLNRRQAHAAGRHELGSHHAALGRGYHALSEIQRIRSPAGQYATGSVPLPTALGSWLRWTGR
jgi:hypothetical protein